ADVENPGLVVVGVLWPVSHVVPARDGVLGRNERRVDAAEPERLPVGCQVVPTRRLPLRLGRARLGEGRSLRDRLCRGQSRSSRILGWRSLVALEDGLPGRAVADEVEAHFGRAVEAQAE